jgi:G6PDH family F420-dependent oxidoreductase
MVSLGYFLSSEEFTPSQLVEQARWAEEVGFERLWISDHYHPWNHEQGQSPFVWSVIGALSQATSLPVTTAVTCPTVRIHPAVIAHAAATASIQLDGKFVLGVGSGEALNEHVFGDAWPDADTRLEMLTEAVELIRKLHAGGVVDHEGKHYRVQHAEIFTLPERPVPIYVSGMAPKAARLAGRIGDGFVSTGPDADLVKAFRENGGGDKPAQGGMKACWAPDEASARKTVHRLWPNHAVPGELSQVLPTPEHFEQVSTLVTEDQAAQTAVCGPDPDKHIERIRSYVDAGFDEVYVSQIGPEQRGFFDFYAEHILPRFARAGAGAGR